MNHRVEPITEIDFQAYVDDELPTGRRIEVEAHMCRHAADAARVMADLRTRDELRLALTDIPLTPGRNYRRGPAIGAGALARSNPGFARAEVPRPLLDATTTISESAMHSW